MIPPPHLLALLHIYEVKAEVFDVPESNEHLLKYQREQKKFSCCWSGHLEIHSVFPLPQNYSALGIAPD